MFELLHAVLTSLLLSAGMGFGVDQTVAGETEPGDSENGVDIGSMPSYLASLRGPATNDDAGDDDLPASLAIQNFFTEPTVWGTYSDTSLKAVYPAVAFATSGRSP